MAIKSVALKLQWEIGDLAAQLQGAIGREKVKIMKRMAVNARNAAEFLADGVRHEYANEPKRPLASGESRTPLYLTHKLCEAVVALPSKSSSEVQEWRVTMKPGVHHPNSKLTMHALAGIHEGGNAHVPARPVWEPALVKNRDRVIKIMSGEL